MEEVVKKEVIKLLDSGIIYHFCDNISVSPLYVVPRKEGLMVVPNEKNKLILMRVSLVQIMPVKTFFKSSGVDPFSWI